MQEGWPAAEWTPRELLERCGDREVPVEVSSGGGDYRDAYDDAKCQPGRTFDASVPVPLSLLLDVMQSTHEQEPDQAGNQVQLYLAQRDVAEVLPELAANIPEAPPFPGLAERLHQRSVWGSKTIRLYSPEQTQSLYPFANPFLRNTSQVDVLSPDLDRHPMFASVPYLECTLRPGDMLYIPRKWWHSVWARTASLSISYWWTAVC
ncbi:Bifunctional peptidase and arginyl-hydroxylase JMJD5 [Coccomyxa sp. Obi]|nr:Bifunctional peptidase and arginyl-hydroxylase JMJD5 [Coccomyxa sp. Obi]